MVLQSLPGNIYYSTEIGADGTLRIGDALVHLE
jgi:hypothetical protein